MLAGHTLCVESLLGAGGQPAHSDGAGRSSVHLACARGRASVLRQLLDHSPSACDALAAGLSPLHLAAAGDHVECIDLLISTIERVGGSGKDGGGGGRAGGDDDVKGGSKLGAAIDAAAVGELTPLHLAAAQGALSALNALLAAGADATTAGQRSKKRPLHTACEHGRGAAVGLLLASGANAKADANAPDTHGSTPLHWACKAGCRDAVSVLLRAGAQPDARTSSLSTPLHLACEAGSAACASLLLRASASATAADSNGVTPMHAASAVGSLACVELLLAAEGGEKEGGVEGGGEGGGEGVAAAGMAAANALMCFEGKHDLSGLSETYTKGPLYLASEKGHAEVVSRLLRAGADVHALATIETAQSSTKTSAVWAAKRAGHGAVVAVLEAAGGQEAAETVEKEAGQVV